MSQTATNEMIRVLSGTRLKYTIRVHKPDGSVIEWQADEMPKVEFHSEIRALVLNYGYASAPIMEWEKGMILLVEINPGAKP